MEPVLSTYGLVYVLSALVPLGALPHTWRHRALPGARWLLALLVAAGVWTFTNGMAYAQFSAAVRVDFSRLSYLASGAAPVFFFLFAVEYAGRGRRVGASLVAGLLALPVLATVAAFTNELHHLVWTSIYPTPTMPQLLTYDHGPVYWALLLYGMVLAILGLPVVFRHARQTRQLKPVHAAALTAAIALPIAAEVLYSFFPDSVPGFDSAMVVGFAATLMAITLLRSRIFEPIPIARESLLEQIPEGLIVVDEDGRLIDVNSASLGLLRIARGAVGERLDAILPGWEGFERIAHATGPEVMAFLVVTPWGTPISVRSWPLLNRAGRQVGRAATLVDLTQERAAESAVDEVRRSVDVLVDEMQGIAGGFRMDTP